MAIARTPDTPDGALGPLVDGVTIVDVDTGRHARPVWSANWSTPTGRGPVPRLLQGRGGRGRADGAAASTTAATSPTATSTAIVYFAGRLGDWMRVDGENLGTAPIERILMRYPDVTEAAVYAIPDPAVGDRVMAALVLPAGHRRSTPDTIPRVPHRAARSRAPSSGRSSFGSAPPCPAPRRSRSSSVNCPPKAPTALIRCTRSRVRHGMRRPDHARRHRDDAARPPRRRAHRAYGRGNATGRGTRWCTNRRPGVRWHRRYAPTVHSTSAYCSTTYRISSSGWAARPWPGRPSSGINPTRGPAEMAADIRHADCQLIVTDSARIPLLRGLDIGLAADRFLAVDGPEYAGSSRRTASRRPPPATPARNDFSCCCSRPVPPGRRRRSGAARAGWPASPTPRSPSTATSATTSTTAACRCSTATRSWRCGPRPWRSARRSASHRHSRRPASCPTSGSSERRSSPTSARRWPT